MALHLPDVQMAWPWTQLAGLVLAIPNGPMGLDDNMPPPGNSDVHDV
jgi:hypothetical protein